MTDSGPDEMFLGLFDEWLRQSEYAELSLRPDGRGFIVRARAGRGEPVLLGRDDESLLVAFLDAISEGGRRRLHPPKVSASVARRFYAHVHGWLAAHPHGEVHADRLGDDRLVSFRSGTDAGSFFGQDGSLVRAVADAAEVARLREHSN